MTQTIQPVSTDKAVQNKRLETAAWGLFLIMVGGFMFIPDTTIAEGYWAIGVGVIMLGLNLVRYTQNIRMSGFTTVLGILAITAGVLQLVQIVPEEGAVLLIILGLYLLVKPFFDRRSLFGKAEQD